MTRMTQLMMFLLRFEITGAELDRTRFDGMTGDDWLHLYQLSKRHDLSHLVGDALLKNDLIPDGEVKSKFEKQMMTAVYRYQTLQYALDEIRRVLNEAKIPFLPLKGSVIRQFYPEPWMRTSCDIDILVHEEDFYRANNVMKQKGYSQCAHTGHDISFSSSTGVHIELHYTLIEKDQIGKPEQLLKAIWKYAELIDNSYEYVLSDSMFYYYHLAHMAKHIEGGGGCGIRPFLDLWILNHCNQDNISKRNSILSKGGLDKFATAANELVNYWMEGKEPSLLASQLEEFVISGGVYGSLENSAVIGTGKRNSKFRYLLYRIWMPYLKLCTLYPSLKGKRILQPFYEIRRWFRLFKKDTFKRSRAELKASTSVSEEQTKQTNQMLSDLGLL